MGKTTPGDRLKDFFLSCVRRSFCDLGLVDPAIIEYTAGVLARFARSDAVYRFRTLSGRRLDTVVGMLSHRPSDGLAPASSLERERGMRKYIGDYTLFMSGLFRAHTEHDGVLDYYIREGSLSYQKVAELDVSLYQTGFRLFQELAANFEYYSGALDYMRQAHFASDPGSDPFGSFLSRVEGWIRLNLSDN